MKIKTPKIRKKAIKPISSRKLVRSMKSKYKAMISKKDAGKDMSVRPSNVYFYGGTKNYNFPYPPGPPKKKEEKKEEKEEGGIKIDLPKAGSPLQGIVSSEEREMLRNIKLVYPLIPSHPKPKERVFAYARVAWDEKRNNIIYSIIEPYATPQDLKIVEDLKKEMEEKLDVDFMKLGEVQAKELVVEEIGNLLATKEIDRKKMEVIQYYIQRDIIGLGVIEPLMKDHDIEDISCDGHGIPIYIYHRNPLLGSLITNVSFKDEDELDSFVMKLAQKSGKSISVAEPLVDGSLPDGSRVQATLGTDIARRGSNFTIRKFTKNPITPVRMIHDGTLDSTLFAYLWLAIEHRKSVLISGGTATGKTSLLNALSLFIRPSLKIVSIEDTPELRLPHPHWVPEVARTPIAIGKRSGEVSLFDLLKESLRQRPDYIIVGEVRGKEAFVLFQQIATGHAGLATIHAATLPQLVDRLTTPPISLPPTLIENIDIMVFLRQVKLKDRYLRRANDILEIKGFKGEKPLTESVFKWKPVKDGFQSVGKSIVLENIAQMLGQTEKSIINEIRVRKSILDWMVEKQMFDYRDVSEIINGYYSNPDRIINLVEGL